MVEEEEEDKMQELQANRFGKRLHFRIKSSFTSDMREYPGFLFYFFRSPPLQLKAAALLRRFKLVGQKKKRITWPGECSANR